MAEIPMTATIEFRAPGGARPLGEVSHVPSELQAELHTSVPLGHDPLPCLWVDDHDPATDEFASRLRASPCALTDPNRVVI